VLEKALNGAKALLGSHGLPVIELQSRLGGVHAIADELDAAEAAYVSACHALARKPAATDAADTQPSDAVADDVMPKAAYKAVAGQVFELTRELARRRMATGNTEAGLSLLTAVAEARRSLSLGERAPPVVPTVELAKILKAAQMHGQAGELDQADSLLVTGLIHADAAEQPELVGRLFRLLGEVRGARGDAEGLAKCYGTGLAVLEAASPTRRHAIEAELLGALGFAEVSRGQTEEAAALLSRALALHPEADEQGRPHPQEAVLANALGMAYETLAAGAASGPYVEKAIAAYERALAAAETRPHRVAINRNLGTLLKQANESARARTALEAAMADVEAAEAEVTADEASVVTDADADARPPPAEQLSPQLALEVRAALGQFLWQAGEPAKALEPLTLAIKEHHVLHKGGKQPQAGGADPQATPLYAALGTVYYDLERWQEALDWLTLAVEGGAHFYEPESPALGMLHFRAGLAASRLDQARVSLAHLSRARALWLPVANKDPLVIQTQLAIALCHATLNELDQARVAATEAYELGKEVLGEAHNITSGARELLENLPPQTPTQAP
jgi:tetratricopeptide (TPR) repeat protein